jgi:predicted ribosomally synthesized peptide with nif11-like leader
MKTLGEFVRRLQVDAAFEKQAQAFDNGDELMAFIKSAGYDFTLDQLADEFKQGANLPTEEERPTPAPPAVSASTPSGPDGAAFLKQPEGFPQGEKSLRSTSANFSRAQSGERLQTPTGEMPPPGPEEESPGGVSRSGGGRHRGFSPQRLRSLPVEDP